MKRVSILGATGSIGQNTVDLIARAPKEFDVVAVEGAAIMVNTRETESVQRPGAEDLSDILGSAPRADCRHRP